MRDLDDAQDRERVRARTRRGPSRPAARPSRSDSTSACTNSITTYVDPLSSTPRSKTAGTWGTPIAASASASRSSASPADALSARATLMATELLVRHALGEKHRAEAALPQRLPHAERRQRRRRHDERHRLVLAGRRRGRRRSVRGTDRRRVANAPAAGRTTNHRNTYPIGGRAHDDKARSAIGQGCECRCVTHVGARADGWLPLASPSTDADGELDGAAAAPAAADRRRACRRSSRPSRPAAPRSWRRRPGAGKTTRVPRALLDPGARDREIWVLEPRRLPARLAATRVAGELGERVGETVGYSVRFDEAGGPGTRLRFITEGLFVRRLLAAPRLPGVGAVVLDELHERHVATDLALAWLRRLRETDRPDLAIVAMSATLDADPVADFVGRRRRAQRGTDVRRRDRAPARARRSAARRAGRRRRPSRAARRQGRRPAGVPARARARSSAPRRRSRSCPASATSRCCRCTARCRSRSRRAPCARAIGGRSSCRRTSPNRR